MLLPEKIQFITSSRYSEEERYMEEKIKDPASAKSYDLIYLCYSYSKLKKYNKLFPCLEHLEKNIKQGDTSGYKNIYDSIALFPSDLSSMLYVLRSEAYMELGDFSKAVASASKAYQLSEAMTWSSGDRMINAPVYYKLLTLRTLALAYALLGERNSAIRYAEMLEQQSVGFGGSSLFRREKLIGLARIYMALGQYDKILSEQNLLLDAIGSFGELLSGGENLFTFSELPKQFMLNKSFCETGHLNEAKAGYDELLRNPGTKYNGELYWTILFDRGRIAEKELNLKETIYFYERAVDVIEQQRSTISTEASKIGFVGNKQAVYHNLVQVLYQDKQYEKAFEYVERAKSRALVDLLASKKDFAVKGGNEQDIRTTLAMNDSAETEAIIQDASIDKNKTRSLQIKIREDIKTKAPELASLITITSQSIAELQMYIPKDEALIEYYYRDKDIYVFILSDGKLQAVRLDSEGLIGDIREFRKYLETPGSTQFMDISRRLYAHLFKPLESALSKENLIIVPHGVLHYLPFNALHDGKDFLIDRYSIRVMPSASAMKYLTAKKVEKAGDIIIFGNPDLGDSRYDLAFAQKEALDVAKTRLKSKVFLRKDATMGAFTKYGSGFSYIHFATHGQFNPDSPLKSALLLAPDSESNGMLTADKLYSLKLDADLVTLSACETGLSKIANGDDLVGLTRGFLYAGCNSIVASLWKVDDLATATLMVDFYSGLNRMNKQQALRTAQLMTKKKYAHPYYWASFQLTGSAK